MKTLTLVNVKMGNGFDTAGANVEQAVMFEQNGRNFKAFTKRGIAVGVRMEREEGNFFYSTMLIPYNYPNAQQPSVELEEVVKKLEVIITSKNDALVKEKAMELFHSQVAI